MISVFGQRQQQPELYSSYENDMWWNNKIIGLDF